MKNLNTLSKGFVLLISTTVAGTASAQYFSTDNLMPSPHYHGGNPVFLVPAIQLTGIDLDISNGQVSPPGPGAQKISSFFDVFVQVDLSTNGQPTVMYNSRATGKVKISDGGGGGLYNTEMSQLDISGGNLPAGMMIRESPTKLSAGQTTITTVTGGFQINSFFDVFTELSLDNGATWNAASGPEHLVGGAVPEPASVLAIVAGVTGLLIRRRKRS